MAEKAGGAVCLCVCVRGELRGVLDVVGTPAGANQEAIDQFPLSSQSWRALSPLD